VGTGASYAELLGVEKIEQFEAQLAAWLGLPFYLVTGQTYPRKQDYDVVCTLAGMGASLHKFAFDLRFLQSPSIGEWSEPFGQKQVGSSAMPFKRNPIQAEKVDSLARLLAQFPRLAWDNAAHSLLERTLDDSANRRVLLPEAFLISSELLLVTNRLIAGLRVDQNAMNRNLATFGQFAATERVLMALGKAGADRQHMHELLRKYSMAAWQAREAGDPSRLVEDLCDDEEIAKYLTDEEIHELMDSSQYVGDAPQRARDLAHIIREAIA
jgi:adenylosuccinate lyase